MKRNFNTKLSGQIGENLVVAELGRRNIIATAFRQPGLKLCFASK